MRSQAKRKNKDGLCDDDFDGRVTLAIDAVRLHHSAERVLQDLKEHVVLGNRVQIRGKREGTKEDVQDGSECT